MIVPIGSSAKYAPDVPASCSDRPSGVDAGSGTTGTDGSAVTFAAATPRSAVRTGPPPDDAAPLPGADTCFS